MKTNRATREKNANLFTLRFKLHQPKTITSTPPTSAKASN